MSEYLLHVGATVNCLHQGKAEAFAPGQRVKVGGQAVLTQSTLHTVTGCTLSGSSSPCVSAKWLTAASRVKASGEAVLLKDSQASCDPNSTDVTIVSTQTRVRGT